MKKLIASVFLFTLSIFSAKSQMLTDGEHRIGLYASIHNGKVIGSAKPASSKSYIYVKNENNVIAIFLDGILIESITYDKQNIKKDGGSYTFQAKSINDLIDRNCAIDTDVEDTPGFANFALGRGNGSFDVYSIEK